MKLKFLTIIAGLFFTLTLGFQMVEAQETKIKNGELTDIPAEVP